MTQEFHKVPDLHRVELVIDAWNVRVPGLGVMILSRGTRGTIRGLGVTHHMVEIDGPEAIVELPVHVLRTILDMEN